MHTIPEDTGNDPVTPTKLTKRKWFWPVVAGAAVLIVLLVALVPYAYRESTKTKAIALEKPLAAEWDIARSKLSDCIVKIRETAGVARGAVKELDGILTRVISARYNQPNGPEVDAGQSFSGLVEAYPNLSGLEANFTRVMEVVIGCRTDYQTQQEKVRQRGASYEAWVDGSWARRTFGGSLPTSGLKITTTDMESGQDITLTGQEALDRINRLIVVRDANTAYATGELETEDPFGEE